MQIFKFLNLLYLFCVFVHFHSIIVSPYYIRFIIVYLFAMSCLVAKLHSIWVLHYTRKKKKKKKKLNTNYKSRKSFIWRLWSVFINTGCVLVVLIIPLKENKTRFKCISLFQQFDQCSSLFCCSVISQNFLWSFSCYCSVHLNPVQINDLSLCHINARSVYAYNTELQSNSTKLVWFDGV